MITRPLASFSILFAAVVLSGADHAPPAAQAPQAGAAEERVCENITVVGSRLARRRVCATRAEWAERRKQDREVTEQFQTMRNNPCNSSNQPSSSTGQC